jgi:hypothetical protein
MQCWKAAVGTMRVWLYWWSIYVVLFICLIYNVLFCLIIHLFLARRIEMVCFIRRGCLEANKVPSLSKRLV